MGFRNSNLRRRLLPLNLVYWAISRLHAAWMRLGASSRGRPPGPPLVVIGALRAGGSGKTSVTAALALALRARGFSVGILCRRIGPGRGRSGDGGAAAQRVFPDSDWRLFSDEAVLLARETGCPVFAVRDRAAARLELADRGFDVLLSDDGFQDRRLAGAFRVLLQAPGERPGFRDLLPAGDFRETASARARADLVLEGPWPVFSDSSDAFGPEAACADGDSRIHRFGRRFIPGDAREGWDRDGPIVALAALGDAAPFLSDLERAGFRPARVIRGRNHAALPVSALRAALAGQPRARIVCTAKEAVRLEGEAAAPEGIMAAGQEIRLERRTVERIAAFGREGRARRKQSWEGSAGNANLVH